MTLSESVKTCLGPKYFFKFQGRASRSEFWWFMLFIGLVNLVSGLLFALFPPMVGASLSLIVSLLLLPANLGVSVRRLHDRNLHGWWLLLPLGSLFVAILFGSQDNMIANLLSLSMCICYLAILCMPSQTGANHFGEEPCEHAF